MIFRCYNCHQPTDKILSHRCQERDVEIEQGKEYKRRDGVKVTQARGPVGEDSPGRQMWMGSDGNCRYTDGKYPNRVMDGLDLIAEWTDEPEGRTLAELDVKPGDVVGFKHGEYTLGRQSTEGRWYEVDDDIMPLVSEGGWHIVSRANEPDKPKWGPWKLFPEDKSWCNVAEEEGVEIEVAEDQRGDVIAVRSRRIEPKRETVTVNLGIYFASDGWRSHNTTVPYDDCSSKMRATMALVDGQPIPGTYTNEAGDVITMTEIQD